MVSREKVIDSVRTDPKKVNKLKIFLLGALVVLAIFLFFEFSGLAKPESIERFLLKFGLWAPLMIIFLQTIQSMISIIPLQVTTVAAGYIFGPVFGIIYSMVGTTIGSALIFLISRKYGEKLALKFFQKGEMNHFKLFFKQKKTKALFLGRVAPIFPNDLVSLAAGLTKINFWKFNLISMAGFLIQIVILSHFGSELSQGKTSLPLILISVLVAFLFLVMVFKKQIKKVIIKDLKKVEKGLKKGVKIVF